MSELIFDGPSISWFMPVVKSYGESESGPRIVEGVASTEDWDGQDEQIVLDGMDFGDFLSTGFINWNHKNEPRFVIGVPVEADIRQIEGKPSFYVKARLFEDSDEATYIWKLIKNLEKIHGEGFSGNQRIGWSIEGVVDSRDKDPNGRIRKCKLRMVAMTHEPVNENTWAMVAKSFSRKEGDGLVTTNDLSEVDANGGFEGEESDEPEEKARTEKTLESTNGGPLRLENLDSGMINGPRRISRPKIRRTGDEQGDLIDRIYRARVFPSLYGADEIPIGKSLTQYTVPEMVTFLAKNDFSAIAEDEIIEAWGEANRGSHQ